MFRASFFRRLIGSTHPKSKPIRRGRLAVETLEAREVPAVITVTSLLDNTTIDNKVTLREAIQAAETDASVDGSTAGSGADTIQFAADLFSGGPKTIALTVAGDTTEGNSAFAVGTRVTIQGPAAGLTLSAAPNTMRLFLVNGDGDLTLDRLTLTDGLRSNGLEPGPDGGAILNIGTLVVTDSTIGGNHAISGGGLDNRGTATVSRSTLSNNSALNGGGIFNEFGGILTITNSTISGNAADYSGGGIVNAGNLTLTNSTVTHNRANRNGITIGACGGLERGTYAESVLTNTIVAGNFVGTGTTASDIHGPIDTDKSFNNLIGTGGSGELQGDVNGNQVGVDVAAVLDPALAANGGPTKTHALLPGSPAINDGTSTGAPATDQRGAGRSDAVDIGAYEFSLVVDTTDDETDGINAGKVSLRDAIAAANANPGADTIDVGVTGTINLTGALPDLSSDITITGPGANLLNVHRNTDGLYRIFTIDSGVTAAISGLTVSNGSARNGGGILNMGTLELTNCTVSGNAANFGGGIQNSGTLTLTNCTVSDNTANAVQTISFGEGGGIHNVGMLTLTNCTVSGNNAVNFGGGIFNSSSAGELTLTNCTVSGNNAVNFGGGIFNSSSGGEPTLTNCTVTQNHADNDNNGFGSGGGILNDGNTMTLLNTIVADNYKGSGNTATKNDIYIADTGTIDAASSNNLIGTGGSGGLVDGVNDNIVGVADPMLGALADNGGPTKTHALLPGSPAINAGKNSLIPAGVTTDQRGFARITGGTVDIGAFEVQNQAPTVTDFTKVGAENNTLAFAAKDFTDHYTDADGDALAKVRIDSLPAGGVLMYNGAAVVTGQVISAADLNLLTFVPNHNFSGQVTFQYSASDGTEFAANPATVTLNIRSADQQAADLDLIVQALVRDGVLTSGQGEALSINLRDNHGDIGKVQAFLNQVKAFLQAGILNQAQANSLLQPGNFLLISVTLR